MIKATIKEFSILSEAEIKATVNTIVVPLILTIITSNVAFGLCWILMLSVIYKYIQKQKVESAKMFFHFLKIEIIIATGISAVLAALIA